jgi:NAD(P)-dependent dehydrogenase (short-subunit alcohol dehydrogenase family)
MSEAGPTQHVPVSELLNLRGRCALVTGGARGIGLAIVRRFAEAGAKVAIGDVDSSSAVRAADEIKAEYGVDTYGGLLDVRDSASVSSFVDDAIKALGALTIWVNNAGIFPVRRITEMTDDEWDEVLNVNLRGTFIGSREAARRMLAHRDREGRVILNIASVSSVRARAGLGHYVASKHGVVGLTKSLAIELGPEGIRVLGLAPALVQTPGLAIRRGNTQQDLKAFEASIAAQLPLGRTPEPDEIAKAALFCVSSMASVVTGTTVYVDAGATT